MTRVVWKSALAAALISGATVVAAQQAVDLSRERVGRPPVAFEPIVGSWVVAQDGADKVIMVDGRPWVAAKDNPTRLLIESARQLYGKPALDYTLGSQPTPTRRGPPHADLYPANNPVLRPPVAGRVGLWSKTDSTSYFKGFAISREN